MALPTLLPESSLTELRACLGVLDQFTFPELEVPPLGSAEPRREHVVCGARRFAFTVVAHLREVLGGYVLLLGGGHGPTSVGVGRMAFELAAQAVHIAHRVRDEVGRGDYTAAWTTLYSANMGSRAMNDKGELTADGNPWPKPIHIMDAIRHLDDRFLKGLVLNGPKGAERLYGELSEFGHPNMPALSCYVSNEERADGTFVQVRLNPDMVVTIDEVCFSVMATLHAVEVLLGLMDSDPTLHAQVRWLMWQMIESETPTAV